MFSASPKQAVPPAIFCTSLLTLVLGVALGSTLPLQAQDQSPSPNGQQTQAPPEAGGPNGDIGPYAIPKKKDEPPPPPPPTKPKAVEGMPDYSIQVNVPLVEVPVMVTTKDGQFISQLKKDNFRIYEDGTAQTISNFNISDAPITAVLLVEYAATNYEFMIDALQASYAFVQSLKKDDWVALEYYDMKPQILVDFTQDKAALVGGLNMLRIPGFSETNMFDALYDTLDRLDRIEGHKYIILVTTGIDSFSKLNLDQITKKVKNTKDITIFPISVGWTLRNWCEVRHCTRYTRGMIPVTPIDYLQADNELQTFARLTGGRLYQPRFQAEYPEIFHDIAGDIRNQYQIAYHPTNPKLDGTYRKLKVEVVAPDGGPLKIRDQKGKDVKYQIIAREGYTAKHTVE
ncbi:MAG: VWA domain-containing protein [Terriglobales bacterium]